MKYVTDEATMQEIFSIYHESRPKDFLIELYVEFEHLTYGVEEADRDMDWEGYNSESEDEFEGNYEIDDPNVDGDDVHCINEPDVEEVANVLASQHPFGESSFMRALDLAALNAPEFPEYVTVDPPIVVDSEFVIGMEFSSREVVVATIKDYTICRGVDYQVYESEPTIFYAKCVQYGNNCDWLIRVSLIRKKYCWEIRRYNGSHTCTRSTISQDHCKLDSDTIAEVIKPLVEANPSLKVRSVIADVQAKFNYTVSYRKAWLAKQKAVEKIVGRWEASYEALPIWFKAMCNKEPSVAVQFEMFLFIEEMSWIRIPGYYSMCSGVFTLVLEHSNIANQLCR
ncbi:hypothetical protein Ahy_B05g078784 [Arachis hypogaea]|uniref:Uncharacterized protein n=3 Tax=Arachis TaxID=3817 RepID=A0A444Z816_ARAHY|nr:hypothetical protein Ahy_B05g078784 [Arachis hypogaea]